MIRLLKIPAILIAACLIPLAATADEDADAWKLAAKHCLAAFEKLNPVDTSEMAAAEAPDWAAAEDGAETFEVSPDIFLMVKGDIETELASCTVAAQAEGLTEGFLGWAKEAALIGIYGPVEGDDLTHIETVDWREPRMQVQIEEKDGITWIRTFEVDKEA